MNRKAAFKLGFFIFILALASISCGAASLPLLSTATPTNTATYTPSPTSTPTQTPRSTPTHTSTPTSLPAGVTSEEQKDGSTLFIDYDNAYQLVLPPDWIIIPVDKDTLSINLDELAKTNPNLVASAEAFKDMDPDMLRMAALNTNMDYFANGSASNITIVAIEDETLSALPLSFISGALEESFKQQGFSVLTTGVNTIENDHNIEMNYMDLEQNINGLKIQQRMILFITSNKLIMMTISTLPQFADEMFQMGDEIGASIEILE